MQILDLRSDKNEFPNIYYVTAKNRLIHEHETDQFPDLATKILIGESEYNNYLSERLMYPTTSWINYVWFLIDTHSLKSLKKLCETAA